MEPVSILASGMVTGVGLNAPASCAAIRCGITNFSETRFMDKGGEWIIGCAVPLPEPWRGRAKLLRLVVPAIQECLTSVRNLQVNEIPLLLCLAERTRPGRLDGLDATMLGEIEAALGVRFHPRSGTVEQGKVGGLVAMKEAGRLFTDEGISLCLIAGVDSFLVASALAAYEESNRLQTSKNSDGFIPGEAGAAVLVSHGSKPNIPTLSCLGIGFGQEPATVESEEPLKADGLVAAIRGALSEAGRTMGDMDYRITDLSGEQYGFKEASLALSRTLRARKERFDLWHPADCIGEVGAAIVPCMLGMLHAATRKNYAPGKNALCHAANDAGERACMIVSSGSSEQAA
ncbi:MAG: 3-oxoacyl-ACP synthase [Nitrospira sp. WS238]|nr:3-oxoacyl-ACP synthase [Nitrospira sp. WS238]